MNRLPPVTSTSIEDVIGGFVPTRRFAGVSFDSYAPDPRYPSQHAARDRLQEFADQIGQRSRAHLLGRLMRKPSSDCTCRSAKWRTRSRGWGLSRRSKRSRAHACCASKWSASTARNFRHRHWNELAAADVAASQEMIEAYAGSDDSRVSIDWRGLASELAAVHPVYYAQIASQLSVLFVHGLRQIDDQAVALRLVHFVDKLHDQEVRLVVSTVDDLPLAEMFSAAYRHGGYEKRYRRCPSRLHELIAESRAIV